MIWYRNSYWTKENSLKKYIINVTKDHIARGWKCSHIKCPVALALSEALDKEVEVTINSFYIHNGHARALPSIAYNFIRDFDFNKPVKPFSFEVTIEDNLY